MVAKIVTTGRCGKLGQVPTIRKTAWSGCILFRLNLYKPGLKPREVQRTIIRNRTILNCVLLSTYDRKI